MSPLDVFLTVRKLYGCGFNTNGQLGFGKDPVREHDRLTEIQVNCKVAAIGCGAYYSVLLSAQGEVFVAGCNKFGQLGTGFFTSCEHFEKIQLNTAVLSFQCGLDHLLLFDEEGQVLSAGKNESGQLGQGSSVGSFSNRFGKSGMMLKSRILLL